MRSLLKINYSKYIISTNLNNIKYKKPKYGPEKCLLNNKTYSLSLYVPFTFKYGNKYLYN